jgi:hypothetical protein
VKPIPLKAFALVNPALRPQLKDAVAAGDWQRALIYTSSQHCISLCVALWSRIPKTERSDVLAAAISGGDLPSKEWKALCRMLAELLNEGRRCFDCDAAKSAYEALPTFVTIYRGTVEAELDGPRYGVCWTLSHEKAVWFATQHGRFRNTRSRPIVLRASVPRERLAGLLCDRDESEVLVVPEHIGRVSVERLAHSRASSTPTEA